MGYSGYLCAVLRSMAGLAGRRSGYGGIGGFGIGIHGLSPFGGFSVSGTGGRFLALVRCAASRHSGAWLQFPSVMLFAVRGVCGYSWPSGFFLKLPRRFGLGYHAESHHLNELEWQWYAADALPVTLTAGWSSTSTLQTVAQVAETYVLVRSRPMPSIVSIAYGRTTMEY